jgi:hypothetical protein
VIVPDEPKPLPVKGIGTDPIPVVIAGDSHPSEVRMPSQTTPEQDRMTAGQREINLIWEQTQMRIALGVMIGSLVTAIALAVFGKILAASELQLASVVFIYGVANLVVGFYFSRTNHTKTGGVGDTAGRER